MSDIVYVIAFTLTALIWYAFGYSRGRVSAFSEVLDMIQDKAK